MRTLFATAITLGLLTGCELPSPKPSANEVVIENSQDLTIGYGSLGPAKVGMTKREALDTGLFGREKFDPADKCKASALKWKKQFKNVEVSTDTAGRIRSLRVVGPGPKTQYGIQVGSDVADIRGPYASSLIGPAKVGTGSGHYVEKDGRWIGFLFAKNPDELDVLDKVTLIEVTDASKPRLQRTC
jgi:hypothetical protein